MLIKNTLVAALIAISAVAMVACSAGSTTQTQTGKYMFVTFESYTGDLGGYSGADSKCTTEANRNGITGSFKAMLFNPIANDDSFESNTTYVNYFNKMAVGTTNSDGRFTQNLSTRVTLINPAISDDSSILHWSNYDVGNDDDVTDLNIANLDLSGVIGGQLDTCNSYTNNSDQFYSTFGSSLFKNAWFFNLWDLVGDDAEPLYTGCSAQLHLVCVQQ